MSESLAEAVYEGYIRPIRTVLAVDDEFPQYGAEPEGKDSERAKMLWRACRNRGLLCDLDDGAALLAASDEFPHHLLNSDLVILDYHLQGEDAKWALRFLCELANSEHASLVVVYTKDPRLAAVRRTIAAHLRGTLPPKSWLRTEDDQAAWDTFAEKINFTPTENLIEAFIAGKSKEWGGDATFRKELEDIGVPKPSRTAVIGAFLESNIKKLAAPVRDTPEIPPPVLGGTEKSPWVYANNLFVVCVQKTPENEKDGDLVFKELERTLQEWNPNFLRCAVAYARGEFARGGFKEERESLSDPILQTGWLYHAWAGSKDEQKDRLRALFERVVSSYSRRILDKVIVFGEKHVPPHQGSAASQATLRAAINALIGDKNGLENEIVHRLNEFLVIEDPSAYVQTGTIFARESDAELKHVYVCVTPACDLQPRLPRTGSWEKELHPSRPIIALRGSLKGMSKERLSEAEHGRSIFMRINGELKTLVLFGSKPPLPVLEWFLVEKMARIEGDRFDAVEFSRAAAAPPAETTSTLNFTSAKMRVLGQIRAIYASLIQQYAGQHLSRIGVDFVDLPSDQEITKTLSG